MVSVKQINEISGLRLRVGNLGSLFVCGLSWERRALRRAPSAQILGKRKTLAGPAARVLQVFVNVEIVAND